MSLLDGIKQFSGATLPQLAQKPKTPTQITPNQSAFTSTVTGKGHDSNVAATKTGNINIESKHSIGLKGLDLALKETLGLHLGNTIMPVNDNDVARDVAASEFPGLRGLTPSDVSGIREGLTELGLEKAPNALAIELVSKNPDTADRASKFLDEFDRLYG